MSYTEGNVVLKITTVEKRRTRGDMIRYSNASMDSVTLILDRLDNLIDQ